MQIALAIALVVLPLVWLVGMIQPRLFAKRYRVPSRIRITTYVVILLLVLLSTLFVTVAVEGASGAQNVSVGIISSDMESDSTNNERMLRQIFRYSPKIAHVSLNSSDGLKPRLLIVMKMTQNLDRASTFTAAAQEVMVVVEEVKEHYQGRISDIEFQMIPARVDGVDEQLHDDLITMVFSMEAVERVAFTDLLNQSFLNNFVVRAESSRAGKELLTPWCVEHERYAQRFCAKILP